MASKIDIINLAMIAIGQQPLVSLSDNTKAARLVLAMYDSRRDAVLQEHPWKFATKRTTLSSPVSTAPAFGWSYAYQLPADFIRFVKMLHLDRQFKIEGGQILSNDGTLDIEYVYRVTQDGLFDAMFVEAFAARLAFELVMPMTGDSSRKEQAWKEYATKIAQAKFSNAVQESGDHLEASTWTDSRF